VCKNSELVLVGKLGALIVQKLKRLNPNRTEFPDRNADSFWSENRANLDCGNGRAGCKEIHSREQVQDVDSTTTRVYFPDRFGGSFRIGLIARVAHRGPENTGEKQVMGSKETHSHEPVMNGTFTTNTCAFPDRHEGAGQVSPFPV
jgi:hypothetical protein